jgi:hypothetical protein
MKVRLRAIRACKLISPLIDQTRFRESLLFRERILVAVDRQVSKGNEHKTFAVFQCTSGSIVFRIYSDITFSWRLLLQAGLGHLFGAEWSRNMAKITVFHRGMADHAGLLRVVLFL